MAAPLLSIFARYPRPGAVKTRLIPTLGEEGATRLYRRLLDITLAAARDSGVPFEVRVTGADPARFAALFADPPRCVAQGPGDLGARLARVTAPAIVIGSDAPGLDAHRIALAARMLEQGEAVIGPARDGGYYLLGYRAPAPFAFAGIAWSTPSVFAETLARFRDRGIEPVIIQPLDDIDTPEDLARHPDLLA